MVLILVLVMHASVIADAATLVVPARLLHTEHDLFVIQLGDWLLDLSASAGLELSPDFTVEYRNSSSSDCRPLHGVLRHMPHTIAAVTLCRERLVTGLVQIDGRRQFTVRPAGEAAPDNGHLVVEQDALDTPHWEIIDTVGAWWWPPGGGRRRRSSRAAAFSSNLTGDTIDIGGGRPWPQIGLDVHRRPAAAADNGRRFDEQPDNETAAPRKWRKEDLLDGEEVGYFFDTAWERDWRHSRRGGDRGAESSGDDVATPTRWLEIAVAADYSVVEFHGVAKVREYIIALMNIVSSIYKDPSLGADFRLVLSRLVLLAERRDSQVRAGNAKRSLENVNRWNREFVATLAAAGHRHHDVAVWLTRLDIGGPSGYAPVSGTCDAARSCALNRDEGLSSAFIIAHEMAHILGLTHDGDHKSGNDCGDEPGSVMAPMVSATFHQFTWSECSRREFHRRALQWSCLSNQPDSGNVTHLDAELPTAFSMDEQCRMEFGNGYVHCRGFDIVEPCTHLWCGHTGSPLVCKTKKGPPLEGTECGYDKWCASGYCELVDVRRVGGERVLHTPRDGGWSAWTSWGGCSRSCGRGVAFRSRYCHNPRPAFGGADCHGKHEEYKICGTQQCPEPLRDLRAQQCARLPQLVEIDDEIRANMTWLSHESDSDALKCQLTCSSRESGEIFLSGENLIDGTFCSYDNANDICIQGECVRVGCDGEINSTVTEDACGDCGGNNSQCTNSIVNVRRRLKRELTRLAVIPRLSRHILIEVTVSGAGEDALPLTLVLKDRSKRNYSLTAPPHAAARTLIVDGTRFHYQRHGNVVRLHGRGPLLAELVLHMAALAEGGTVVGEVPEVAVRTKYNQHREAVRESARYRWVEGGWGPCSASCGGGRRQRTLACRDAVARRLVARHHCSLAAKPTLRVQTCNDISCSFVWIEGPWEFCSHTCGSHGMQSRQLFCVHQTSVAALQNVSEPIWRHMVRPDRCPEGGRPAAVRPCNRSPCPVYWVFGPWSQCSTTCGAGVEVREVYCPVLAGEPQFTCGPVPPDLTRSCRLDAGPGGAAGRCGGRRDASPQGSSSHHRRRRRRCVRDAARQCRLMHLLGRYCVLGEFRKICCKSCARNELPT